MMHMFLSFKTHFACMQVLANPRLVECTLMVTPGLLGVYCNTITHTCNKLDQGTYLA